MKMRAVYVGPQGNYNLMFNYSYKIKVKMKKKYIEVELHNGPSLFYHDMMELLAHWRFSNKNGYTTTIIFNDDEIYINQGD